MASDQWGFVYVGADTEGSEIFAVRADGQERDQITSDGVNKGAPDVSELGVALAYVSMPPDSGAELWVVDGEGAVLMAGREPLPAIGSLEVATVPQGGRALIKPGDDSLIQWTAWSRRDLALAFRGITEDTNGIFVSSPVGKTALRRSSEEILGGTSLSWSADGELLAFDSAYDNRGQLRWIRTIRADGSDFETLVSETYSDESPSWSPCEDELLFISVLDFGDMGEQIFMMDASGGNRRALTGTKSFKRWATWSPNGRNVAYGEVIVGEAGSVTNRRLSWIDVEGMSNRVVAEGVDVNPRYFRWAPDSLHLAFLRGKPTESELVVVNVLTGEATVLARGVLHGDIDWGLWAAIEGWAP